MQLIYSKVKNRIYIINSKSLTEILLERICFNLNNKSLWLEVYQELIQWSNLCLSVNLPILLIRLARSLLTTILWLDRP